MLSLYPYSSCGVSFVYKAHNHKSHSISGLHSTVIVFCVIYTGPVSEQTGCLFFSLIDCSEQFIFSSPPLLRLCLAEIGIEHIDWSAVGSIDPQGQTASYWQMVLQCPPSLVPSSSFSLPLVLPLYPQCVICHSHNFITLRSEFIPASVYPFCFHSLSWGCCCCRLSVHPRSMQGKVGIGPTGRRKRPYKSKDSNMNPIWHSY